jgi:adenylate cyclase
VKKCDVFCKVLLLWLLLPATVYGQRASQARVDSLVARLEMTREDTAKVTLLVRIANNYRFMQSAKARDYYQQGVDLSAKAGAPKYIMLANESMRSYLFSQKDFEGADRYFEHLQKLADPDLRAQSLMAAGYDYYQAGQNDRALHYFKRGVSLPGISLRNASLLNLYLGSAYYSRLDSAAIPHYQKALSGFTRLNDRTNMRMILQNLGGFYMSVRQDFKASMKYYRQAVDMGRGLPEDQSSAMLKRTLASVYQVTGDTVSALALYGDALKTLKRIGDTNGVIQLLGNMSMLHFEQKDYNQALKEGEEVLALTEGKASKTELEQYYNTLSWIYYTKKDYEKALAMLQKVLPTKNRTILGTIGSIYRDAPEAVLRKAGIDPANRYQLALSYLEESLKGAETDKQLGPVFYRDSYQELSLAYEKVKDYPKAYAYFNRYVTLKDSIAQLFNSKELVRIVEESKHFHIEDSLKLQEQMVNSRLEKQVLIAMQQQQALLLNRQQLTLANREKDLQRLNFLKTQAFLQVEQGKRKVKEQQLKTARQEQQLAETSLLLQKSELAAQRTQGKIFLGGIACLLLISFFIGKNYIDQRRSNRLLTRANTEITEANAQISFEKQRSEDLLLNILPADVAEELKEKGSANARLFDEVTVLFTDFVNFTTVSERLSPAELVSELHFCFMAFDRIISNYRIEKIKTIGDAYLAVGGLPNADKDHAVNIVKAALEIRAFVQRRKAEVGDRTFDIRIGIHSGSVVAGIVGVKKFAYDIWGDTVNTAARMEQNSVPGEINISETTYILTRNVFSFTYRGEITAKNKGALKMYFVETPQPEPERTGPVPVSHSPEPVNC